LTLATKRYSSKSNKQPINRFYASHTGKVKWFNQRKGYGFLTVDKTNEEIFVHFKDIKMEGFKTLRDEQGVEFDVEPSNKGKVAKNVSPTSQPPGTGTHHTGRTFERRRNFDREDDNKIE